MNENSFLLFKPNNYKTPEIYAFTISVAVFMSALLVMGGVVGRRLVEGKRCLKRN